MTIRKKARGSTPSIQNLALFKVLTSREKEVLARSANLMQWSRGNGLFPQGDRLKEAYFIVSGKVKLFHGDDTGRESIIDIVGPNDVVGLPLLFANTVAQLSAEALTDTVAYAVPRETLDRLFASSPEFTRHVLELFSEQLVKYVHIVLGHCKKQVMERVACALVRLARLEADNTTPVIQIKREDLASMAGTTIESAVRCLTKLRQNGILDGASREIRILRLNDLREVAGFVMR